MFSLFAKISESFLRGHRILYVSKMIMFFSFYVASTFVQWVAGGGEKSREEHTYLMRARAHDGY